MIIYKVTNKLSGKCYIGQTVNKMEQRWSAHKRKKCCTALSAAIQKYGSNAFDVEVLETCLSLEEMDFLEIYYIKFYDSLAPNGYNLHTGGANHTVSDETREKQSKSHRGKHTAGTFKMGAKPHPKAIENSVKARKGKPAWNRGLRRAAYAAAIKST